MTDFVDATAFNFEQGQRARKLFAAVVLAALDDAISERVAALEEIIRAARPETSAGGTPP